MQPPLPSLTQPAPALGASLICDSDLRHVSPGQQGWRPEGKPGGGVSLCPWLRVLVTVRGAPSEVSGYLPRWQGWVHPAPGSGESPGQGRGRTAVPEGLRLLPAGPRSWAPPKHRSRRSALETPQAPLPPALSPPTFSFKVKNAHSLFLLPSVNSLTRLPARGPQKGGGPRGQRRGEARPGGSVPPPRRHEGCTKPQGLRGLGTPPGLLTEKVGVRGHPLCSPDPGGQQGPTFPLSPGLRQKTELLGADVPFHARSGQTTLRFRSSFVWLVGRVRCPSPFPSLPRTPSCSCPPPARPWTSGPR